MSFNALNINKSADIQSAFLGSAIDAAINGVSQTAGFIPLPPKPTNYHVGSFADIEQIERDQKRSEQLEYSRRLLSLAEGSEATKDNSLVKKTKSPTRSEKEDGRRIELDSQLSMLGFNQRAKESQVKHLELLKTIPEPLGLPAYNVKNEQHSLCLSRGMDGLIIANKHTGEILKPRTGQSSAVAHISQREWSGQTRIRICAQTSLGKPPPSQSGDRVTKTLNVRAAGKILDSGAYVSVMRGGYTTFFTPTFSPEARKRLKEEHFFKVKNGKKGDVVSGEIYSEFNYTEIKLVPKGRGKKRKLKYQRSRNVRIGDVIDGDVKASGPFTKLGYGISTIGSEISRFFDAASRTYQRGWYTKKPTVKHTNIGPIKIPARTKVEASSFSVVRALHSSVGPVKMECYGEREKLDYLWVAESPEQKGRFNVEHTAIGPVKKNNFVVEHSKFGPVKKMDRNPHCHVLMRWNVEPHLFREWADRLESQWGLGFAKLERIKNKDAASGYLLKAIGYVLKGSASDQGEIKGNRYNISSSARAPAWEHIATFDAQNMCAIINEVKEKWHRKDAPIKAVINKAQKDLLERQKAYNIQRAKKGRTRARRNEILGNVQASIAKLEKKIKDSYQQLKQRGARASEYQITFDSFDKMATFVGWASSTRLFAAEMLDNYSSDYSEQRAAWGHLAKTARDYFKGLGDNQENQEMIWPHRMNQPINDDFEGVSTDEYYNDYYNCQGAMQC